MIQNVENGLKMIARSTGAITGEWLFSSTGKRRRPRPDRGRGQAIYRSSLSFRFSQSGITRPRRP
jgi:hypothetical protein